MKRFELFLNVLQVPVDFFLLVAAGVTAYILRFTPVFISWKPVLFHVTRADYTQVVFFVAMGWIILFALLGLYSSDSSRRFIPDVLKIIFACSAGLSGVALYIMFTQQVFDSRFLAAVSWGIALVYVVAGRLVMYGVKLLFYRAGIGNRRVVIIGDTTATESIANLLRSKKSLGYTVVAVYASLSDVVILKNDSFDELIYARPLRDGADAVRAIQWCIEHQVTFKYSADLFATYATNMSVHPIGGIPIIEIRRTKLEGWWRIVKRGADILLSICILVFTSPLVLFAALAVFWETGRPVFYRNERIGLYGKKFATLKLRSMYQKDCTGPQFGNAGRLAEEREKELIQTHNVRFGPIYKIANDPRVTRIGSVLRRLSIDELPQFLNVLAGDMSIVGPRPHQPREVAQYDSHHKRVFFMKPGITGLAQISGRSDLSSEEELTLDVFYLEHWSVWLDIIIFLKTPFLLFRKRKAV